jgi:hypothetical protein
MTLRACGRFAYEVSSESGNTYFVHLGAEACTCPDWRKRHPENGFDILPALKGEDSRPPLGYCGLRRCLFSRCEASAL